MTLQVTINRASLSLPPLVIDSDPFADDFHLPEEGVSRPAFAMRRQYAPDSAWVGGRRLMSTVAEAATLPLTIYAHGSSEAQLAINMALLTQAATQFVFDVTVSIDGIATTYSAEGEFPVWGDVDSGMTKAHLAKATLVLPVNP